MVQMIVVENQMVILENRNHHRISKLMFSLMCFQNFEILVLGIVPHQNFWFSK